MQSFRYFPLHCLLSVVITIFVCQAVVSHFHFLGQEGKGKLECLMSLDENNLSMCTASSPFATYFFPNLRQFQRGLLSSHRTV
jgi:hypothetical protein